MPSKLSTFRADTAIQSTTARQCLTELHAALARIGEDNTDTALRPLIVQSLSHCAVLARYFDRPPSPPDAAAAVVDAKVFERLMLLAGPETARELLDQLLVDLGSAQAAIAGTSQQIDWNILRMQCHILVAVAGSVGATQVLRQAELLRAAAQHFDTDAAPRLMADLLQQLQALIAFVRVEQVSRAVA